VIANLVAVCSEWEPTVASAVSTERPQQLHDLLRVLPPLARPGPVAESVQGFADLHMRLALPPQFDGFGDHLGVDGPQVFGDDVLGLPGAGRLPLDGVGAGQEYPK
jgi:hypothetical protein